MTVTETVPAGKALLDELQEQIKMATAVNQTPNSPEKTIARNASTLLRSMASSDDVTAREREAVAKLVQKFGKLAPDVFTKTRGNELYEAVRLLFKMAPEYRPEGFDAKRAARLTDEWGAFRGGRKVSLVPAA